MTHFISKTLADLLKAMREPEHLTLFDGIVTLSTLRERFAIQAVFIGLQTLLAEDIFSREYAGYHAGVLLMEEVKNVDRFPNLYKIIDAHAATLLLALSTINAPMPPMLKHTDLTPFYWTAKIVKELVV